MILFFTIDIGCLEPSVIGAPGRDKSPYTPEVSSLAFMATLRLFTFSCAAFFKVLMAWPNSFFGHY